MTSITKIQKFVVIFQNIEIIDTFIKTLNDRIVNQLKTEFVIINAKKRRIYLQHKLTQFEIEREIDSFVALVLEIETKGYLRYKCV